uniref:Uncharacterized protein n=1 Tax=Arundo donax TaxID=35708 RepID=A0A0A8YYJ4_ARUDO
MVVMFNWFGRAFLFSSQIRESGIHRVYEGEGCLTLSLRRHMTCSQRNQKTFSPQAVSIF